MAGNQVLLKKKDSEELGESTVLQEKVLQEKVLQSGTRGNRILLCTLPRHNAFHSIHCSSIAICVVRASATSDSPVTTLTLSKAPLSVFTP
jgi:hypothetical protein